jgi:hypothetical protein
MKIKKKTALLIYNSWTVKVPNLFRFSGKYSEAFEILN